MTLATQGSRRPLLRSEESQADLSVGPSATHQLFLDTEISKHCPEDSGVGRGPSQPEQPVSVIHTQLPRGLMWLNCQAMLLIGSVIKAGWEGQ